MDMLESFKKRARLLGKTIVLPEGTDPRTIKAAAMITEEKIAEVIVLGNPSQIEQLASAQKVSTDGFQIIDIDNYSRKEELILSLAELRKDKGVDRKKAEELLSSPLYMGVMMVKAGIADGMVAGAINATADVLRPSLQILKTAPGTKLVSSFFVMIVPDCDLGAEGGFLFADPGMVQNPNSEELAHIAVNAAQSFKTLFQKEPVVGMLSHSTKGSASHPDVDKVVEATRIAKDIAPELLLDGEFQLDAAIVPSVGASKAPESDVAGKCNVLVFPDLDAANIGYKLTQRLAKAEAYGPVTQGIAKPVNDLSRGCTADDITAVVAITAIQSESN
ncbi:MAG: phosphate acetyltransferase [Spirochaetes bacterium]|jgi:phosphate acetyltransferase|nr:phosphate acetyltransferase [Spirochaetota bacterium]